MRKNLSFGFAMAVAIILLNLQEATSQNSSPYWSLAGNSNASTSSKLGTTNGVPLRLFTNNATRIYISSGGNVGIGTTTPAYKLHVSGNASVSNGLYVGNNGVYGYNSGGPGVYGSGSSYGVYGTSYGGNGVYATSTNGYGVYANSSYNYGVYSTSGTIGVYGSGVNSSGSGTGYGLYGYGYTNGTNSYDKAIGVFGVAGSSSGRTSYGVYGLGLRGVYGVTYTGGGNAMYAEANAASAYGLSAISYQSIALYSYTGNSSSYAGFFLGKVYSSGGYTSSDRKLKQDVTEVSDAMNIINKLQPKTYRFRQDGDYKLMNLPQGIHYGLIAQDVEQVLPDLISEAEFDPAKVPMPGKAPSLSLQPGANTTPPAITAEPERKGEIIPFKTLNYTELIPILVKAVQELSKKNEEQQAQIDNMKETISKLAPGLALNSKLGQNTPNPGSSSTSIRYTLPQRYQRAELVISDNVGRAIKTMRLNNSGVVNIDTSTLSSGVYNYSLIVDNNTIETKKMTIIRK